MVIKYTVFGSGGTLVANNLRHQAAEVATPAAIVKELIEPGPQTYPHNVVLDVPRPVPHFVSIYSTPDTSIGVLVAGPFTYDPTYTNVAFRMPLEIKVGSGDDFDPGANANSLDLSVLVSEGWQFSIERRANSGTMSKDEIVFNTSGVGTLQITDDVFSADEYLFIHFIPQYTTATPIIVNTSVYSGINFITAAETSVTSDWYAQMNVFNYATAHAQILHLQPLGLVPDTSLLRLSTYAGKQTQVSILTDSDNPIIYNGQEVTALYMGANEKLHLLKGTDGYYVENDFQGMCRAGTSWESYLYVDQPGKLLYDGGAILRLDWPRVAWIVDKLPVGGVIGIAARNLDYTKAGLWGTSTDGLTLYKPDLRGVHRRNMPLNRQLPGLVPIDSQRGILSMPGSYGGSFVKDHTHQALNADGTPDPTAAFLMYSPNGPNGTRSDNTSGSTRNHRLNTHTGGVNGVVLSENTVQTIGIYYGIYS